MKLTNLIPPNVSADQLEYSEIWINILQLWSSCMKDYGIFKSGQTHKQGAALILCQPKPADVLWTLTGKAHFGAGCETPIQDRTDKSSATGCSPIEMWMGGVNLASTVLEVKVQFICCMGDFRGLALEGRQNLLSVHPCGRLCIIYTLCVFVAGHLFPANPEISSFCWYWVSVFSCEDTATTV